MDLPSVDDIEAQSFTETQPANIPDSLPLPATNIANPQLPTTAEPPQTTNANEHHNGNAPAQQTADNSQVQRGMLTFPFHQLQAHSCARREPWRLF
jgi:hypothetical protein